MPAAPVMQSATQLPCPACGRPPGSSLACLRCGRLLDEPAGATHFQRLGLPPAERVDRQALESTYLRLSRLLHPDFHGGSDDAGRALALRNSALLNEAHAVLLDDEQRAEYLLGLHDPQALERWKNLPPQFLMQALETSEEIEAAAGAGDRQALAALAARTRGEIAARVAQLAEAEPWRQPDTRRLATLLHELRVFHRILRDAEQAA